MPRLDYLLASDDALIAQSEVDRYRASGPGGQHRNKTESAVRLRHPATGVSAIGEDSRSQAENKLHAVRRLRAAIALGVREPVVLEAWVPSPRLAALVAGGTAPLGAKTRHTGAYWAAIAELLDVLVAGGLGAADRREELGGPRGTQPRARQHPIEAPAQCMEATHDTANLALTGARELAARVAAIGRDVVSDPVTDDMEAHERV